VPSVPFPEMLSSRVPNNSYAVCLVVSLPELTILPVDMRGLPARNAGSPLSRPYAITRYPAAARLRARAALSSAPSRRAADWTRTTLSSGGSVPAGSTCRSRRALMAERAAAAWSARAIGRDHRACAAILARNRRCSEVTLFPRRLRSWLYRGAVAVAAGFVPACLVRPRCRTAHQRRSHKPGTGRERGIGCGSAGLQWPDCRWAERRSRGRWSCRARARSISAWCPRWPAPEPVVTAGRNLEDGRVVGHDEAPLLMGRGERDPKWISDYKSELRLIACVKGTLAWRRWRHVTGAVDRRCD
jgi:hypothetical protein